MGKTVMTIRLKKETKEALQKLYKYFRDKDIISDWDEFIRKIVLPAVYEKYFRPIVR